MNTSNDRRQKAVANQSQGFGMMDQLEIRLALSTATIDAESGPYTFHDLDGDRVVVQIEGPGSARLEMLDGDRLNPDGPRRINSIRLADTDSTTHFSIHVEMVVVPWRNLILIPEGSRPGTTRVRSMTAGVVGQIDLPESVLIDGQGVIVARVEDRMNAGTLLAGADIVVGEFGPAADVVVSGVESTRKIRSTIASPAAPFSMDIGSPNTFVRSLSVILGAEISIFSVRGYPQPEDVLVDIPGIDRASGMTPADSVILSDHVRVMAFDGDASGLTIDAGRIEDLRFDGDLDGLSLRARSIDRINGLGSISNSTIEADSLGFLVLTSGSLHGTSVRVDGAVRAIAALDHSADGLFGAVRNSTIRASGRLGALIANDLAALGARSGDDVGLVRTLPNNRSGSGAAQGVRITAAGRISDALFAPGVHHSSNTLLGSVPFGDAVRTLGGRALAGSLPGVPWSLDATDVESILEQAIARARQLGVNATISVTDHEGNILGALRMTDGSLIADPGFSTISAGGVGGLEGVGGAASALPIPSSIFATTKAGTAAFLSTRGNAFSTRTAGYIIQHNFPPGIRFQDSGPLFGVQFSSLPTSDINRLPLGLSADPGGLPLYLGSDAVGGIGVELDGVYTVDPTRIGGDATLEELIALAGQTGFTPPSNIRADRILVDGVRLDYANAEPPTLAALLTGAGIPDLGSLGADVQLFIPPRDAPMSMFTQTMIDGIMGNTISTFVDGGGAFVPVAGAVSGGQQLTAGDVESILGAAHERNIRLRAMIRRDSPQVSQVSVSVVDLNGALLGVFRSPDAPVFGLDVSVQKARSAAFLSRTDAGSLLSAAEGGAFAGFAARAAAVGITLDGSIALSERAIGFLSRPSFPDGIPNTPAGPFSIGTGEAFSPFNTGLQVQLLLTNLAAFVGTFNGVGDEGTALSMFDAGLLGGGGVAAPALGLANGLQIFPGAVPLYKGGVLVGAIGVSGDGIEQDDAVAFAGASGFQDAASIFRSDNVFLTGRDLNFRLPYIKLPRSAGAGI